MNPFKVLESWIFKLKGIYPEGPFNLKKNPTLYIICVCVCVRTQDCHLLQF